MSEKSEFGRGMVICLVKFARLFGYLKKSKGAKEKWENED